MTAPGPPGLGEGLGLGVEEELIAVDAATLALAHTGGDVLAAIEVPEGSGSAHPDTFAALVELASPIAATPEDGVRALAALRERALAAAGRVRTALIGAGVHPDGAFGDVVHVDEPRYDAIHQQLRGLLRRTPTSALHVHVGMPDRETAIHVCNDLREWLPLLQALAGNSPFWHGADSGLATARAQLFRGYPRSDIPPAFADFAHFEETVAAVVAAGDASDYTFLWWDIRPHPKLGTVEVRAMDAQSSLRAVHGLVALVVGLARAALDDGPGAGRRAWSPREALEESSFRAARDGIRATLLHDGALRPVPEIAAAALARAGDDPALSEIDRILREGAGADRQRAAFARGGMRAVLELLAAETADLNAYR